MPDGQLFSRNAASAAHFRSARVNYVRLIESADRRFISDRIAGISFRPIPTSARHRRTLLSPLAFPLSPVNLRFARRSKLLSKHHSVEKFLKNRTGARDVRYWISPAIGLTAHTNARTRISYCLYPTYARLSFETP